jgi:hypothetical protein
MWEEDVREATPKDTINHVVCGRAMLWLPILARLSALPEPAQLALCRSQRAQPILAFAMFVFVLLHPIFTSAKTDPSGTEVALKQARDEANRGWWYETGQ